MSQRLRFMFEDEILPKLRGADHEEDEDENGDENDEDENGGGDGDDPNDAGGNSNSVSRSDYDKAIERMKLADKRATAAEKKAKEYEDKDKSELQRLQDAAKEKDDLIETANSRVAELQVQNAFLTDNTYLWHNPKTALRLLDMDSVQISEDGEVTGMADALKKLADENPYLVKSASDDKSGDTSGGGGGSTGEGSNKRKGKQGPDKKALAKKYPALHGRV